MNMKKKMLCWGLLSFVVMGVCVFAAVRIVEHNNRKTAKLEAEIKSKEITRIMDSYVNDLNIWGALLDKYGEEVVTRDFTNLAKEIYSESIENIRSVQLAPGGVVTYIYPYKGNEEAKGHDLFADPERVKEATLARETGDIILSGPLTLKQGGSAVISRKPIYSTVSTEKDQFWGFVVIVMDLDKIAEQFGLESYEYEGYDYCLYRRYEGDTLIAAQSTEAELKNPVEVDVTVPTNITWKLRVRPKDGWISGGELASICIAALLVYALVMCFVHFYCRRKYDIVREQMRQAELSSALKQAEAASEAKSEFLRRMSHDIRTPINGIIGMTNIALRNLQNPDRTKDCLHKIEDSSQHLCLLINDVLDMSRIESGRADTSKTPFDLLAVSEKCSSIIRGQLVGKKVAFETDFSGITHAKLKGTVANLERIIVNILGNSVKFTPEGGSIRFCITELFTDSDNPEKALFQFRFEDTGIGMSAGFLPTIFDEFSQDIEQSRTNYQGTGLGMAITKKYVDLMGGRIEVESEQGVGTKFLVEIPFPIENEMEENREQGNGDFSLDGRNVLLVEDNELNAEITAEIVQGEGAKITIVENGKLAVEEFARSETEYYDLILMDIMMPEMDGITATKKIRQMERADAKTVPIVAMTANAFEEDKEVALSAGMSGYVMKPIDLENLKKSLEAVLSKEKVR